MAPTGRLGRLVARAKGVPTERDWERADVVDTQPVGPVPERISDGSGLPFSPNELARAPGPLDPADPVVGALANGPGIDGFRLLARSDDEALFGRGVPPNLHTVVVAREGRRGAWTCVAQSAGKPLRATREGIRASSWRLDPGHEPAPEDTVLRILVTEQTYAGGRRATGRLLVPDLHESDEWLVLTLYVTPQQGFQMRAPNPETPVLVQLPNPVGSRRVIDGALYEPAVAAG